MGAREIIPPAILVVDKPGAPAVLVYVDWSGGTNYQLNLSTPTGVHAAYPAGVERIRAECDRIIAGFIAEVRGIYPRSTVTYEKE